MITSRMKLAAQLPGLGLRDFHQPWFAAEDRYGL